MVRESETAKAKKKQMEQKKEKGKERAGERSHHKDAGKQEFKKEKEELGEGSPGTFDAPLVYGVKRQSLKVELVLGRHASAFSLLKCDAYRDVLQ